ncbi:hypothetical protein JST56_07045 [Candidatus Dependentiae bacterium]|nr:hypothetical protein [Candidatus Dependentiae bacterium]
MQIDQEGNVTNILTQTSYGNGNSRNAVLLQRQSRGTINNPNAATVSGDLIGAWQTQGNTGSAFLNSNYLFIQAAEDWKDTGKHAGANVRWQIYGTSNNGAGGNDTSLKDRQQYSSATNTWAFIPIGASYNYNGGLGIGRPGNLISGRLDIGIGLPTETGVTIRGAASQTANLWQLLNSVGSTLASADANGNIDAPNLIDSVTVRNDSLFEWKNGVKTFRYLHTAGAGGGITSLNSLTGSTQIFATGTSGSDFNISSSSTTHTFNIPTASGTNRGALSPTDWTTFNNKQAALGFTPENTANKATSFSTINNTLFPTVQACSTYVANAISALSSVYAPITHTHAWTDITSTPTTIAGYGITDYNSLWDTRFATKHRIDSANYADTAKYASTSGNAINLNGHADTYFTPANGTITGATKTKITYDSKGLVTAGADATTADIAASTNKNYVTDAQLVVIGNTSGTNTGDQTSVTGNAGTATTLQTARNIYGNSFNGSADVTGIISSTYGGTGNGFFTVSGPATSAKTFTFPNANATIARTDAGQTFTGVQTFSSSPVVSSFTNTGTHSLPTVTGTIVEYVEGNTTSASTITPTGDARQNYYDVTALATAPTFAAPSGTPANHNLLTIRIKDNGTARALTWNAIYRAGTTVSLPTTTTISKTMHVQFEYNSADTKWDLVGVVDGF